jgi:lysophospholipase L1-like esterase
MLVLLALPSLFAPQEGIRLGKITLKYPTITQLFDFDSIPRPHEVELAPELALLDFLLDSIAIHVEFDTLILVPDTVITEKVDSSEVVKPKIDSQQSLTLEVLKSRRVPIESSDSIFSALKPFFEALSKNNPSRKQVRILHYGDSQIEGDRITSFLRSRLQARFGGRGVGLLHAVPHSYQPGAVKQTVSTNWQKNHLPDLGKGALDHRFGILGGYSFFTSSHRVFSKGGFNEAWIQFQRVGQKQLPARNFSTCRILYGYATEPFLISLNINSVTKEAEMMAPSKSIDQIKWNVPADVNSFQIDFKGDDSPLVYGISLESATGIVVDNIAIRGSSGTDFSRSDDGSLKRFMQLINPGLIILQFGVNLVPNIVQSYDYYEKQLYNQIVALKRAKPDVAIIVIGVSDMSRKEGGQFVSYPNIEKIRDAQRKAAFKGGAAFWDCYRAMGGKNSMPAWVYANPPLASKDFIHFSFRGSNLIAEMFYASLMEEYDEYLLWDGGEVVN